MHRLSWSRGLLAAALIAPMLSACNYVEATGTNPNAVPDASVNQLFVSAQLNTFFMTEGQLSRLPSMWTQQMAGTDRQFTVLGEYIFSEGDANGEFSSMYTGGGLVDLKTAEQAAEGANRSAYAGILKIQEAYMIGMGASIWGDIPYSEAADPSIATPKLDKQEDVYAALQTLLDGAITDLAGGGAGPSTVDMNFGGDAAKWTAVAHTLKARLYMHWVEAQKAGVAAASTACGGDCLQQAASNAQQGIMSASGNWMTVHSQAQTEANLWYQFQNDRSGYISAGAYMVNLLKDRGDPRLAIYFGKSTSGDYVGADPGQATGDVSTLSTDGAGAPAYQEPMVSCAENQFILAEASYDNGDMGTARSALKAGIACQEAHFGITIPDDNADALSGADLLQEIMTQKYIAQFLNPDVWNDYKRTCLPAVQSYGGKTIPGRLYYGETERQTNPNIPSADAQPARNTNDPASCQ